MPKLHINRLWANQSGVATIDYALVVVLIAMTLVVIIMSTGFSLNDVFQSIADALPVGGS